MTHQWIGRLNPTRNARVPGASRLTACERDDEATDEQVHAVLDSPARPLDSQDAAAMQRRLGHDFSHVRVHSGTTADESVRQLGAAAYTAGDHVVMSTPALALPATEQHSLLAHELTHVVQQQHTTLVEGASLGVGQAGDAYEHEADQAATSPGSGAISQHFGEPMIQRNLWRNITGLFAGEDFDEATLHDYLRVIRESGEPEGITDSDNKARAVVRAWKEGGSPYVITPTLMTTMIKEMQAGATFDEDEQAILELLERADNHHLGKVFGPGGVNVRGLIGDFDGHEEDELFDFFERRFTGGRAGLLGGSATPKGRPIRLGMALGSPAPVQHPGDEVAQPGCSIMRPEECHSYEGWIRLFADLPTGRSASGHAVIGLEPNAQDRPPAASRTDPNAPDSARRPARLHGAPYTSEDHFIDGPTDEWVRANLPALLVEIAYQLPTDCADIAVVLRHVWLAAHGRTENYRGWVCGAALSESRSRAIQTLLTSNVWTGSVARIVNPHVDDNGTPLRSWTAIEPVLRTGDVLVWDHTLPGQSGHTHTVMNIVRDREGRVTQLDLLQGNQPISRRGAEALAPDDPDRVSRLRAAPGRRIERSLLEADELRDRNGLWTWDDDQTVIVAAGPPVAAGRPGARSGRQGPNIVQGLTDWIPEVTAAATIFEVQSQFEAALIETRTRIESGQEAGEGDAENFGRAVGQRLWQLANESARDRATDAARRARRRRAGRRPRDAELLAEDLAASSHYRPLQHMIGMLAELGASSRSRETRRVFAEVSAALTSGGRGASTISFNRTEPANTEVANVLVAGFDPFSIGPDDQGRNHQVATERGRVNPSGAAVLQLDGTTEPISTGRVAAVEGVIMPVSFGEFRSGLVESTLTPHSNNLDVVLTVSMSPGLRPADPADPQSQAAPLRLERFAVGVHELNNHRLEAIPGLPGSTQPSPAIIEARGAEGVTQAAGLTADEVLERRDVTFSFTTVAEANRALGALGLPSQRRTQVTISDLAALQTIVASMERGIGGVGITFQLGASSFQAQVLSGPGGDFLSNEVSFRVLRFIAAGGGREGASSFHINTQRPTAAPLGTLPQSVGTDEERVERRAALDMARGVVRDLVTNLKALIRAAADAVLTSRSP